MKSLALDLGTSLGWAKHCSYSGLSVGTLVLASETNLRHAKKLRMDRRLDIRIQAFSSWLESQPVDQIFFEDVKFASSQAQAHLWGSLRGVVWSYAARRNILIDCLDTGKLKKWTTGSGSADKPAMLAAAVRRWTDEIHSTWDDNAVDAFCLLKWAQEIYR